MYRKELCPSLLDHAAHEQENEEGRPKMRWHKVLITARQVLLSLIYQDSIIADTIHVFVAALGCSDLGPEVATSSEAQACFADLL